jgi:response regulator RpfG family c-di-GMP phosphodiesterase
MRGSALRPSYSSGASVVERASVLVASRDAAQRNLLAEILEGDGYGCRTASDRAELLRRVEAERPELLLLDADLEPPILPLLGHVRALDRDVGILIVMGGAERELAVNAVRMGAVDVLSKPFDRVQVSVRTAVALERRERMVSERQYMLAIEQRINERTQEVWEKQERLRRQVMNTVEAFAQSLAAKHQYTEGHSRRVTDVAVVLARAAQVPAKEIPIIELAARFHDIGKIGVRDDVLDKPGSLTDGEFAHVKTHPLVAERILGPIEDFDDMLPIVTDGEERTPLDPHDVHQLRDNQVEDFSHLDPFSLPQFKEDLLYNLIFGHIQFLEVHDPLLGDDITHPSRKHLSDLRLQGSKYLIYLFIVDLEGSFGIHIFQREAWNRNGHS